MTTDLSDVRSAVPALEQRIRELEGERFTALAEAEMWRRRAEVLRQELVQRSGGIEPLPVWGEGGI